MKDKFPIIFVQKRNGYMLFYFMGRKLEYKYKISKRPVHMYDYELTVANKLFMN